MKKLLFILLCLPLIFACNDGNDPVPVSKERTITYKFNTNSAPTGTSNLIGVQIYKGIKAGSLVQYSPYAYGLFDDFSKIKLELPKDAEYKIVSSVVVDGKTKVGKDGNGYLKPFSLGGTAGVQLTNTFTLDDTRAMTLLNQSTTTIAGSNKKSTKESDSSQLEPLDYKIPNLDRYYGEVVEYNGNNADDPAINMQRSVFGIKLSLDDVSNIEEGMNVTFCIYVVGAPDTLKVSNTDAIKEVERVYTLLDETDQMSFRVKFFWIVNNEDLFMASDGGVFDAYKSALMEIKSYPYFKDGSKRWGENIGWRYWYYAPAPTD
ncbi:hypothetical protein IR148_00595 [Dysgonomonas mossii]|uniref:DUF4843 domain-containing protein n=1 Tax=Dysgonomonas mossii TaxID=163665 RepID=A0A4Y9IQI8_9BACT|nr:hypothetical protein [Dysgonomonas mossii]MBF0759540.1 hypothetical protein [Dysgonomonas mossii]TFU90506.1 hypothetical protein E4T88_00590 [Dysgonomonas mossii]